MNMATGIKKGTTFMVNSLQ